MPHRSAEQLPRLSGVKGRKRQQDDDGGLGEVGHDGEAEQGNAAGTSDHAVLGTLRVIEKYR